MCRPAVSKLAGVLAENSHYLHDVLKFGDHRVVVVCGFGRDVSMVVPELSRNDNTH